MQWNYNPFQKSHRLFSFQTGNVSSIKYQCVYYWFVWIRSVIYWINLKIKYNLCNVSRLLHYITIDLNIWSLFTFIFMIIIVIIIMIIPLLPLKILITEVKSFCVTNKLTSQIHFIYITYIWLIYIDISSFFIINCDFYSIISNYYSIKTLSTVIFYRNNVSIFYRFLFLDVRCFYSSFIHLTIHNCTLLKNTITKQFKCIIFPKYTFP